MFKQVELKYNYSDLEPKIDALTMETHYSKHHAAYTNYLNNLVVQAGLENKTIEEIFSSLADIDSNIRAGIKNNGGGFYNHNLYFSTISAQPKAISDKFAKVIEDNFGSLAEMLEQLAKVSAGQFGSGWGWLSVDKSGKLVISATANQDNPLMENKGLTPILAVDVWEHAYYLKYKNLRADYIKAYFDLIDWEVVEIHYNNVVE
ncbi:MAG: superoxide dismutase [Erysipelotrichaceae bacterium]